MKKLFSILILLFVSFYSLADEGRYRRSFKSENKAYELRMLGHKYGKAKFPDGQEYVTIVETNWGLYDLISGYQIYTVKGDFTSKTVLVSNDGKNLAVIDDYSEATPSPELKVLEFYAKDKLQNSYTLVELLCSHLNVSVSVSHMRWFANLDYTYGLNLNFGYDLRKLVITTYEMKTFVFDFKSGELVNTILDSALNESSVLVYGEVNSLGKGNYEIDVCHRVYGKVPESGKLKFKTEKPNNLYDGYQTVLINSGQYTKTKYVLQNWMLNQCRYRHGSKAERNENKCL